MTKRNRFMARIEANYRIVSQIIVPVDKTKGCLIESANADVLLWVAKIAREMGHSVNTGITGAVEVIYN